ncbi:phage head-tail connector protein [Clostridium sp. C105KSO13]|uniref:phage head-tail connector protein n=1 Tax=Clostridium sp. C105KSO13 TaxID=1776045 RepID=UPI00074059D6|nr:phage head-tail connector protein [Clostridium sp. C105KSO13]CUX18500.1 Phage gp6-like head-tail connector protein [Clostridium sp. C105KSO13]
MATLEDVKLMLGIEDSDMDKKLNLIISNAEKQILAYLPEGIGSVPDPLQYIVTELAIVRFNRIGNEGMSSYSQEGESITYGDDIAPYLASIQAWISTQENNKRGRVRFI